MNKTALHNQSVLDFVLHHTGSIQSILEFCVANELSITDDLIAGNSYIISENSTGDKDILGYYLMNGYIPATATTINTDYGIGEMIIERTFIVR